MTVWNAGPLRKGPGICHGTAGNGYAFLKLFHRTGDEVWLARARSFAMHAIAQSERANARYGRGRYTLWTGDPGSPSTSGIASSPSGGLPALRHAGLAKRRAMPIALPRQCSCDPRDVS